jgi:hypothetical protein
MTGAPTLPEGLLAAARWELVLLWNDLEDSVRMLGGYTPCGRHESLRDRIKALSDVAGPARWQDISIPFLLSGTYTLVCAEIGHPSQLPEGERVRLQSARDAETASWRW